MRTVIYRFVNDILNTLLSRKKAEVIRLRWKKDHLERQLAQMKNRQDT